MLTSANHINHIILTRHDTNAIDGVQQYLVGRRPFLSHMDVQLSV